MKLSTQLYLGFAVPAFLLLGIGSYSLVSFARLEYQVETIYDDRVVPLQQLKQISDSYAVFIIDAVNKANDNLLTRQEALRSVQKAREIIDQQWDAYLATKLTDEEKAIAIEVENLFNEANQEIDNLVVVLQTENLDQIAQFDGELYSVIDPVTEKIQELIDLQLEVAAQKRTQATEIYSNIRFLFFILLALAVIVASPVGFVLSRKITATLKETISTLANTSSEIAAATEEHERIAEHQAVSVQQTTATMDELSVSSHQSAKQAEVAATGAQTAYSLTEKGTKAVNDTLEEMFQLKENVRAIANQILQLNEQARQIGTISELVSEIANQTNLLALNAAVEAVHAGEHGKGFSVVASEIRKLADQSKQSVEKISTLVTQIQGSVKATMSVADVGQNSVEKGSKIAQNTATTFNEIAEAVQEITVNSQQISHTAKNQAIAIQQVLEAMTQLNRGAVETSSSITQTKVGTETLSKTAKNLTKMV